MIAIAIAWLFRMVFRSFNQKVVIDQAIKKAKAENSAVLSPPITPLSIRSDAKGDGHFNSSRGNRQHKGVDFIVLPGQKVMSPVEGVVTRHSYPYANDKKWDGLYIKGKNGIDIKLFYIKPLADIIGKTVNVGDTVGYAMKISEKYGAPMIDHIHTETWIDGGAVNPEPLFFSVA